MTYDFDKVIDRRGTGCLKYDCAERRGKSPDLLPLWIADMDFETPDFITDALVERVRRGVYGYTEPDDAYVEAVRGWFGERYGFAPQPEWLIVTPGVVFALAAAVRAFTHEGEGVLIQPPVYYPFIEVIEDNGRRLVAAPLSRDADGGSYHVDFEAFEEAIVQNDVRLFLLCNPHNPVGRVWTAEELRRMGDICLAHDVIVVTDEIHADFARAGHAHTMFASLGERYAAASVTCTAASKTFNLAGLQVSNIFIPDAGLRQRFRKAVDAAGYSQPNVLGLVATRAAYEKGAAWLEQLKAYLDANYEFMVGYLAEHAPELTVCDLQSTYLPWVDCTALGLTAAELTSLVEKGAGLWLDMGDIFGAVGEGFVRFNIACPRAVLAEALRRFAGAVRSRSCSRSHLCTKEGC